MMTGFDGLNDANIIINARQQDARNHLQAIRDAEKAAKGENPNRIKKAVSGVVAFVKRVSSRSVETTQTTEMPAVALSNEQAQTT
jgi:hypothetical protein